MNFFPITETFFQGHVSLERGKDYLRPWRLPFDEIELYTEAWWIEWNLIQQAGESTGVRLRLKTDAPHLTLVCVPLADKERKFDLVCGNALRETISLAAGEAEVTFHLRQPGDSVIEIWLPHNAPCAVQGIRFPQGCAVAPEADARPVMAVYGSSSPTVRARQARPGHGPPLPRASMISISSALASRGNATRIRSWGVS